MERRRVFIFWRSKCGLFFSAVKVVFFEKVCKAGGEICGEPFVAGIVGFSGEGRSLSL